MTIRGPIFAAFFILACVVLRHCLPADDCFLTWLSALGITWLVVEILR